MGYTHYWTPEPDCNPLSWHRFVVACASIFELAAAQGIALGDGCGDNEPVINHDVVVFNGAGSESYESCAVECNGRWTFCKTAHRPYDCVVTAVLALGEHFGILRATSDGDESDWSEGIDLARRVVPDVAVPVGIRE